MADDSELDYLRTFVGEVMTGYTVKHYSEVRNISSINDAQKALVYPGELLYVNSVYYAKRYRLETSDATEAAITTGFKNLIAGTKKYNRRQTGPTQVASMTYISVSLGKQDEEVGKSKRWKLELKLDVIWSVG